VSFSDPRKNIDQFGITEGSRVADLGCGAGFYSIAAAKKVGPDGKVYAVDIQQELLSRLATEAVAEEIENLEVVWGDIQKVGGTKIGDGIVDSVIISNVLFQLEDANGLFGEAYRILKPGGRVLVVEWQDSFGGLGPEQKSIVSEQTTNQFLQSAGFKIMNTIDAGDHHYGIVAKKIKV